MEDVAKEAGVSRALVSIAYRGVEGVSDATREKIFAAGEKLGYVPNLIAARLASKGQDTIGVYLQDLHNDVFADIYDGIKQVTDAAAIQLVLAVGGMNIESQRSALSTLIASRVDVLIAAGLTLPDSEVKKFAKRSRIVTVAREIPGIDSAYSDNFIGAKEATTHLINAGHKNIVFLANPQTDGYLDRQRGYTEAMSACSLQATIIPTSYSRQQASVDAGVLLDSGDRPEAIFAHNDQAALGVLDALVLRGLKPGSDVAVVGYDNSSVSQTPVSALSTVDIHATELGETAARLALSRIHNPERKAEHITLNPTLVVRHSSLV